MIVQQCIFASATLSSF